MTKHLYSILVCVLVFNLTYAQNADTGSGGFTHKGNFKQTKDGTISGTILDSVTKKPLQNATIFIYSQVRDTATGAPKEMLAGNAVAKSDGSFEVNNVPSPGKIRIQVSNIGYDLYNKTVIVSPRTNNTAEAGKLLLKQSSGDLKTVNVTATQPFMQMGVDRKIFNVSQSLVSTGQTAQEVLAQIPSVSVDIDGNVSVRGASPQIYIDGMPTTLTLDQIPSDLIDKVELITNPSAKYDASTGGGGIINITLKKNNAKGYNGGLMAGSDTRGGYNFGGDLNVRMGKFNVFARVHHRTRNQKQTNHSERDNFDNGTETSEINQRGTSINKGGFTFLNLGSDYNLDKKNVFTLSGHYVKGTFTGNQPQTVDSLFADNSTPNSYGNLLSNSNAEFKNLQGEFKYKHNFSDDGEHNLIFDMTYDHSKFDNTSSIHTGTFSDPAFEANSLLTDQLRSTNGDGANKNVVMQADYVNPISKNSKIEAGLRAQIRNTSLTSLQYLDNSPTGIPEGSDIMQRSFLDSMASSRYSYTDRVYAAYGIFSSKIGEKLSYELGARVESSNYGGTDYTIPENVPTHFKIKYPLNLFPSLFVTYNLAQGQNLQVNYSRKINRPNFFQILPVYNYSDPYNIQVGNPGLRPEFTNMYEVSYDNAYGSGGNFLATVYYRHSTDLITSYQYLDPNIVTNGDTALVNSYANAESSNSYGLELTNMITLAKIWDVNLNLNLYNSIINGGDAVYNAKNQRVSWFGKWNNNFRLPGNFTLELMGQYYSKAVLPSSGPSQGGQGNGGGRGFGSGPLGSAQGYIAAHSDVDAAIKKNWKWGKGNTLSLTVAVNDIFAGNRSASYSVTPFMVQNAYRMPQPRIVRFTLSYRFGKMDFKKKGQQQQSDDNGGDDNGGMEMGG